MKSFFLPLATLLIFLCLLALIIARFMNASVVVVDHDFKIRGHDIVVGAASAPVDVVIFSSPTCTHCGDWDRYQRPRLQGLVDQGRIRLIIRNYPVDTRSLLLTSWLACFPPSQRSLVYTEMMEHQQEWSKTDSASLFAKIENVLKSVTADENSKMIECAVNSDHMLIIIQEQKDDQRTWKIGGTPSFLIGNTMFLGKMDADAMIKMIK